MKILVVTYSSEISGGANPAMLNVLKGLMKDYSCKVKVVLPSKGNLCDSLDKLGIPWVICQYSNLSVYKGHSFVSYAKYIWMYFRCIKNIIAAKRFAAIISDEHYDLVYTNEVMCFFGAFLGYFLKIPHVWHFRSHAPGTWLPFFANSIYQNTNGKIIAISNFILDFIEKKQKVRNRGVLIHDGVDLHGNIPFLHHSREHGLHLLHCGRIDPQKQQDIALQALKILIDKGYKDIYLHFAGSVASSVNDSYYERLLKYIEINCMENYVIWEGQVKDMVSLRKNMNVELMCSKAEPFGLVTVEGMHSSLLVIGTNSGGTKDLIVDKVTGLLCIPNDAADLASKIEYVYIHPTEADKIAANAYKYVQTHFTIEDNVKSIFNLMKSLL